MFRVRCGGYWRKKFFGGNREEGNALAAVGKRVAQCGVGIAVLFLFRIVVWRVDFELGCILCAALGWEEVAAGPHNTEENSSEAGANQVIWVQCQSHKIGNRRPQPMLQFGVSLELKGGNQEHSKLGCSQVRSGVNCYSYRKEVQALWVEILVLLSNQLRVDCSQHPSLEVGRLAESMLAH